jgi:hypothetical protein
MRQRDPGKFQEKVMFPRPNRPDHPRLSPFTPYTALLALLWLLLVAYIITHPDPIGVIILIVMGVFIVGPTLFLWALIRRQRQARDRAGDEYETPAGQNGRYAANAANGANGVNGTQQYEPDEVSGEVSSEISEETPEEGSENP